MEPTNAELIIGTIIAIIGLIFLLVAYASKDDPIEIDDFKRRDWRNREKGWN